MFATHLSADKVAMWNPFRQTTL